MSICEEQTQTEAFIQQSSLVRVIKQSLQIESVLPRYVTDIKYQYISSLAIVCFMFLGGVFS